MKLSLLSNNPSKFQVANLESGINGNPNDYYHNKTIYSWG